MKTEEVENEVWVSGFNTIKVPEYSEWRCHLFGGGADFGIVWRPIKGQEPNAFWRWMQFICFGNRWVKE